MWRLVWGTCGLVGAKQEARMVGAAGQGAAALGTYVAVGLIGDRLANSEKRDCMLEVLVA